MGETLHKKGDQKNIKKEKNDIKPKKKKKAKKASVG